MKFFAYVLYHDREKWGTTLNFGGNTLAIVECEYPFAVNSENYGQVGLATLSARSPTPADAAVEEICKLAFRKKLTKFCIWNSNWHRWDSFRTMNDWYSRVEGAPDASI